jgi:acyl carrier protein
MYAMQTTELVLQFLQERIGVDPARVVSTARLDELGVDSLMLAELVFEAEDRLGLSVGTPDRSPQTVGDVVALIDRLRAAKAATS